MTLFGIDIQTIYLTTLIISGSLTVLYIFFGDVMDGVGEGLAFLNPALILAFIVFLSSSGYVFELVTPFSSILILSISIAFAFLMSVLLHFFILVPLSSAEESLVFTEESLKGRVGKIIISIPENGFGEIVIDGKSGMISRPAASYENNPIAEGTEVLVLDIKDRVLYVTPYDLDSEMTIN
ncbi:NfeD family protein [Ornithinibacillus scapharcae]|uniref:NfeD family protein n=1 Tax=Ornithinibacillus scapharcae TaxID=1147159 RepID=UPI000225ADC3|nr:NfeD family protein [Ornithinibacillus scapharcae]